MKTERVEWGVQWRSKPITGDEWFPYDTPKSTEIEARIQLRHARTRKQKHVEARLIKRTIIEEVVE